MFSTSTFCPTVPCTLPFASTRPERVGTVLVADQSPADRRLAAAIVQRDLGLPIRYAAHGAEAVDLIRREPPAVVLAAIHMPMLDGPGLVDAVRTRYPLVPVVLLTAQGMAAATARALRNGAAGYVPKSQIKRRLTPTVARLLANATVNHQRYDMLQNLTQIEITFCLANNSRQVPSVVSFLQEQLARMNLCDETDRIRVGVALEEAITNAIYHGNLQVSSELREQGEDVFHAEATRRRLSRPYRDRHVRLTATITHAEARFVIVDEGPGFNRANLPDPTDPANLDKPSGRGLLLIHHFMDEVKHNQAGNQITLIKRRHAA